MTDTTDDRDRNRQPNTAGLAQGIDRHGDDDVEPPQSAERSDSDGSGDGSGDSDESADETADTTDDTPAVDDQGDDLPSVPDDGWKAVDSPVDVTILSVDFTAAGPVATGAAGKVLHRNPETGEWRVIIEAGVSVDRNNIHDMDVTDDGERFWFVGDSGIIGAFDVAEGRKYDFSAPMEKTSTWESVGVTGAAGEELVVFANGSGELLPARMDEHGYPEWGTVHKPGRGSTMPGVDFDGQTAYAIDTTGKAYQRDFSDTDLEDEVAGKPGASERDEDPDEGDDDPTSEEADGSGEVESVDDNAEVESVDESGSDEADGDEADGDEDTDGAGGDTDTGGEDPEADGAGTTADDAADGDEDAAASSGGNTAALGRVQDAAGGDWASPETTLREAQADPEWTEIGVRNAQVNFHDVDCHDGHLLIAGDDGILYRYDRLARNWTPVKAGDGMLSAVDQRGDRRIVGGTDGHVFEPEAMVGWQPRSTETFEDLHGIALGDDYDVAVGASGVILERHPDPDADEDGDADAGETDDAEAADSAESTDRN